mgnify:CR=1 FL=1
MNSDNFIKLSPTKLFFRCAVPAAITSVFGALYNVIDGIFVGRYLGGDALAAINLIMPVIIIAEAVSNMIATGVEQGNKEDKKDDKVTDLTDTQKAQKLTEDNKKEQQK